MGWGVQSWTMAAMVALGKLPPVDYVVHTDTTYEHQHTYRFAEEQTKWLESKGVKVITVKNPVEGLITNNSKGIYIPAHIKYKTENVDSDGNPVFKKAIMRRQCTEEWKIVPIRRFLREEIKRRNYKRVPGVVEQWLGISLDEYTRAKDSQVKYIKHIFPLLDLKFSRQDCIDYLKDNNLPIPGKSSCVFCPYKSYASWRELKGQPVDLELAIKVDEEIRHIGNLESEHNLYVHFDCKPLSETLSIEDNISDNDFDLDDAQCDSGYCFI